MKQNLLKNSFLRGVLCLLLCIVGIGNAWGEEVTLNYSNVIGKGTSGGGGGFEYTISPINFTFSDAYGNSGHIKAYGASTITFSGATITKIVITATSKDYIKTWNDGTDKITVSEEKATWKGSANSVTLKNTAASQARIKTIAVTYEKDANAPIIESLAISGTASNTTYYVGDTPSAEGLVVTATYNDESTKVVTSSVSWSFEPATIQSSTTLVTATASYEGITASTTYNITVNSIANTEESAYTIAQAYELIDNNRGLTEEVYVKGIISQIDSYNSTYGSITYWISDDGTTTSQQFQCYSGLNIDGTQFTSINDLKLGSVVVVKGLLKKYNTTYEFDKNNVIISNDETNARTLSSIEISGTPTKTSYYVGDTPSADGLIVNAVYSDESTIDVTDDTEWTVSPETITEGTTQVTATASYNGLTASHTYSIIATRDPKIKDYTLLEDGKKYYIGATLSNGTDYYFSTTYTNIVEAVKGVAQTDKANANILTAIANSSDKTKWAFQFENGYYLSLKDSQDNGKVRIIAQKTYWVLSNTTKGLINMTTNGFCLQRNNSSTNTNFGSYKNTQTDIWFIEVPTYDVEISSAGYATFCLPYDATIPEGLTAYTANDNGESVKLTAIKRGKIAAGEGVVLKGEEGTYTFVATAEDVSATASNQMAGVTEETELNASDNAYLLTRDKNTQAIAFRKLATTYTLGANKAYLKLENNARNLISVVWDDNATGIYDLSEKKEENDGAIYNLAGQKLTRTQKGINIINGKLVIK